jgi:Bacterial regulatory proteins, tetR family
VEEGILEAACKVFLERGLEGAVIKEIAEAALGKADDLRPITSLSSFPWWCGMLFPVSRGSDSGFRVAASI